MEFSDLYINISKDDIKYISSLIKQNKENKLKFKTRKTIHYIQKPEKENSHEITFIITGKLNLLDFSLLVEKRKKKFEIIYSKFETNSKIFIPKEKEKIIQKNIKLNLGKVIILSILDDGKEYNILEYKDNMNNNFEQKHLIKIGQKFKSKNQLELIIT